MKRNSKLTIVTAAGIAVLTAIAVYAQDKLDKYSLKSPSGIAFADFKGYEDRSVVSSARSIRTTSVSARSLL